MVRTTALLAATAAFAVNAHAESMYSAKSNVLSITGMDYDRLIARSNYTSIVEFYAPWCGHCKNLKPAYETAAKSLAGIAKVAAINCDEEMNKPFCGQMGVQGFPTLKIVRPGKKSGKPTVEDYQGERSAKGIVNAVKDKVPNSVKRVNDKNLDEWLQENKDTAKAILFSDKGIVSATLRALAIDFAGLVSAASATEENIEEPVVPTESPDPNIKSDDTPEPIVLPKEEVKPTIPIISEASELQALCLNEQSTTCILAILPEDDSSEPAQTAIDSLATIHKKHTTRTSHLFPFVGISASNPIAASLLSTLNLGDEKVPLIAVHGKRAWFKKYSGNGLSIEAVEQWVDAIRMGEGKKEKLPDSLLAAGEKQEEKTAAEEPVQIKIEEIVEDDATPPEHNEL